MMSNIDQRLKHAGEAWNRIFRNAKPLKNKKNISFQDNKTPQQKNIIKLNMENLVSNQPWGDILQEKPTGTTRIYSQNVNGLQYQKDGGQYLELCQITKEVQADVLCVQEHNLDTTQYQVQHTLHQTTRKQWQRAKLTVSSSPIAFQGTWKPGGTAILSVASITGRLAGCGHDAWGRWSHQTFRGQQGFQLTVISAYQVVAQSGTSKGQFTAGTQQHSLLLRQRDPITKPRQAFQRDLSDFIQDKRSKGNAILLIGDFNERLGEDPSGLSKIAAQFELVDLLQHHHQHLHEPATYARGHKRLDYALGTINVANAVIACGYEQFNLRFHTDHRALFLDFDTRKLFGASTQHLENYPTRILHSNNIRQVTKYMQGRKSLYCPNGCQWGQQGWIIQKQSRQNYKVSMIHCYCRKPR
jgi:exonuclease III